MGHEEALCSSDPLLRLEALALAAVVALVPTSVALLIRVTRRLTIENAVALTSERLDFSLAREWDRYVADAHHLDPFAPHNLGRQAATILTLGELRGDQGRTVRSLQSLGLDDRLTLYLRSAGGVVATIALVRSAGLGAFTAPEALALRRLHPVLEQAYLCAIVPRDDSAKGYWAEELTARESDVAELVARGATNAEIARSLHVSEATVKTHLTRIYDKTGVRSRTQLAILLGAEQGNGAG